MASFFDIDKQNGRLYFVTKDTDDIFVETNLVEKNINEIVFERLKKDGYENVIFYSLRKKLFFYDQDSTTFTTDPGHSKPNDDYDVFVPFTEDFDIVEDTTIPSTTPDDSGSNKRYHMGRLNDLDIQKIFEARMNDESRKTAIVIENADDYIRFFGAPDIQDRVLSMFNEWERLPPSNKNIMVFIFPRGDKASFDRTYQSCMIWRTYFSERFGRSVNVIDLAKISYGEIKNLINRVRNVNNLKVQSTQMEYIVKELTAYVYSNGISLKSLEIFLQSIATKGETLSKKWIIDNFHHGKENNAFKEVNSLIGMKSVKEALLDLKNKAAREAELHDVFDDAYYSRLDKKECNKKPRSFSLHYALTGNPGTGKTTVAQYLGMVFKELGFLPSGHLVSAKRDTLVSEHVGGTAIKTQEAIDRAMGGVLFIDEAYSLFKKDDDSDFGREAIDTLIENMTHHDGEFAVVIAGYPKEINEMLEKANPGFSRRFKSVIHIDDYTPEELIKIFDFKCKAKGYSSTPELRSLAFRYLSWRYETRDANWGNAGVVDKLVDACYDKWCSLTEPVFDEEKNPMLTMDALPKELATYLEEEKREVSLEDTLKELNELIGLREAKKMISEIEANVEMGDNSVAGHYFFTGNPGTGKTTVARIMGRIFKKLKVLHTDKVLEVSAPELVAGFVGQTALKTKEVLQNGRDGVVLIDEVSTLSGDGFNGDARSTILKYMEDNRDRISIICTGYPNQIEEFLKSDPGFMSRFDAVIDFEDYTADELVEILKNNSKKMGFTLSETFLSASKAVFDAARVNSDFGNGRFVRKYLEKCTKMKNIRLKRTFGSRENVPEDKLKYLIVDDIAEEYRILLNSFDFVEPAEEENEELIETPEPVEEEISDAIDDNEAEDTNDSFEKTEELNDIVENEESSEEPQEVEGENEPSQDDDGSSLEEESNIDEESEMVEESEENKEKTSDDIDSFEDSDFDLI